MNCRHARRLMVLHLDGELEDDTEFRSHLGSCPNCQEQLAGLRIDVKEVARQATSREPLIEPSPYLLARLSQRIDELERHGFLIELACGLRWLCSRERRATAGWSLALVLLCANLGQYIQVEAITTGAPLDQVRIDLHIGSLLRVTLASFTG